MKVGKIAVMAAAILALASMPAKAVINEVKIKGTVYDSDGEKVSKEKFNEDDVMDRMKQLQGTVVPNSQLVIETDVQLAVDESILDEVIYLVDANGALVLDGTDAPLVFLDDFFDGTSSCAVGVKESSSKTTAKATCVELISLFSTSDVADGIDGAATCQGSATFKDTDVTLKKKCHVEAIDPETGLPVEFDFTAGKVADVDSFFDL